MSSFGSHAVHCAAVLAILLVAALGLVHAQSVGEVAYIKASDAEAYDHFACGGGNQGHSGNSIALSGDGSTMAVSAHWESSAATGVNGNADDDSLRQAGAVYVFTRTGTTWTQQAYLKASNTGRPGEGDVPGDGDQFGYAIAISGDGNTLAAGAITEDGADNSADDSGAAYVFMY